MMSFPRFIVLLRVKCSFLFILAAWYLWVPLSILSLLPRFAIYVLFHAFRFTKDRKVRALSSPSTLGNSSAATVLYPYCVFLPSSVQLSSGAILFLAGNVTFLNWGEFSIRCWCWHVPSSSSTIIFHFWHATSPPEAAAANWPLGLLPAISMFEPLLMHVITASFPSFILLTFQASSPKVLAISPIELVWTMIKVTPCCDGHAFSWVRTQSRWSAWSLWFPRHRLSCHFTIFRVNVGAPPLWTFGSASGVRVPLFFIGFFVWALLLSSWLFLSWKVLLPYALQLSYWTKFNWWSCGCLQITFWAGWLSINIFISFDCSFIIPLHFWSFPSRLVVLVLPSTVLVNGSGFRDSFCLLITIINGILGFILLGDLLVLGKCLDWLLNLWENAFFWSGSAAGTLFSAIEPLLLLFTSLPPLIQPPFWVIQLFASPCYP